MDRNIELFKKDDQLFALFKGKEAKAVNIVWLRPASGIGKEISLHSECGESVILDSIDELDINSRRIAKEALDKQYIVAKIKKIYSTDVHLGNRYFDVETDKGRCKFLVKNPFVNIKDVNHDEVRIRDVMGNLYHIESLKEMDRRSVGELEKVR